ncbi:MAG: hypothetical protein U0074_11930 [Kouleothrix sp.]
MSDPHQMPLAELHHKAEMLRKRLAYLEEQRTHFGIYAPPHIVIEYEETNQELAKCMAAIAHRETLQAEEPAPYVGLQAFSSSAANLFFGREHSTLALANALEQAPLITVFGSSGVGKSSLVQAGLLPHLAARTHDHWRYISIMPGARPLDALAEGMARCLAQSLDAAKEYRQHFAEDRRALIRLTGIVPAAHPNERWLVLIDQAEDIWARMPTSAPEREQWLATQQRPLLDLLAATMAEQQPVRPRIVVMLVLRSDFVPHLVDHPLLGIQLRAGLIPVSPLGLEDLHNAIVQPARRAGYRFQDGLVSALLDELRDAPAALPLLQHTLLALWQRRSPNCELTWAAFEQIGRVTGALASTGAHLLDSYFAAPEQRNLLRQLLLRMVQPGCGTPDTRRRVQLADLATPTYDISALQTFLAPLEHARLIVISQEDVYSEATVELAHDTLMRSWPAFQQWIEDARTDLRRCLMIEDAAREWANNKRADDFLWRGNRLEQLASWSDGTSLQLNLRAQEFAAACQAQKNNTGPQPIVHVQATGTQAFSQAVRLAELAAKHGLNEPELALLLAGEALALHDNAVTQEIARALLAGYTTDEQENRWEVGEVLQISFEPNGDTLVAIAEGHQLIIRTLNGQHKQIVRLFRGHKRRVLDAAFSPDNEYIATASQDKTVRLWSVAGGTPIVLQGHTAMVVSVRFSPDAERLVSTSADKTARLWNRQGAPLALLPGHSESVRTAVFSPDGTRLLTIAADRTARLWDASGMFIKQLCGPGATVLDAAFSSDSQFIATAALDASIGIWDTQGCAQAQLYGHRKEVTALGFASNAATLFSASADCTARIWSASRASHAVLSGHTGALTCIAISPNGEHIATGAYDTSVHLWDRTGYDRAMLSTHTNAITHVHFSRDNQYIVTAAADRTIHRALASAEALLNAIEKSVQRRLTNEEIDYFGVSPPGRFGTQPHM